MLTSLQETPKRGGAISTTRHRINEKIRAREIRLIDQAGKQMGIYPLGKALALARERNLDLVEVAPNADPPVCRLMDYGKYVYERTKREREARKAQRKTTEIKEIRLRPKTDSYHIGFKLKRVREFLGEGAKVKVRVLFRGREITHPEIGFALLKKVAAELEDIAIIEHRPRLEGRSMLMILSPISGKR